MTASLNIAPMMDWTDRHCRYFHRLLTPSALLYTEMVHCNAVIHGDAERHLGFSEQERPVALQLGGSDPEAMAAAAAAGERFGYQEVNINVGCPSDRVQSGRFGACLMASPDVVGDCVAAMREAVSVPVTVKSRIGIDDFDTDEFLFDFVGRVAGRGCRVFIVHARIAKLQGLSPKENRSIPPLNYERVYRLKAAFPELTVIINGGIRSPSAMLDHLQHVDGVMIGREAYHNPYVLTDFERALHPGYAPPSRFEVMRRYCDYMAARCDRGIPLRSMARHTLGLFHGQPGARHYRRELGQCLQSDEGIGGIRRLLDQMQARNAAA